MSAHLEPTQAAGRALMLRDLQGPVYMLNLLRFRAMLVRQSSLQAFMAFAQNAAYLEGLAHRTAAIEDSRLLPLTQRR